ncbi:VOC family protein [Saccharopolyspora sp. HNM0986]|uniref:VOC family protein n=1 Tax=Saccharopolyspora galaxeae TaxID=2781241 RepID=UPI00190A4672|nr:VOC family protein [Saccharopolyspora sp. HNM0986]MBK0866314.1 VOC family protein [Saccharopolyspora sp. HNM0986]
MTTVERTGTALTPYLAVNGARQAIEWYGTVFGARLRGEPHVMDDGRIGHAELDVDGCALMLADEFPEIDMASPATRGGASVNLNLQVADVDAVLQRARDAGAPKIWDAEDRFYGRSGRLDDPFGHRWQITTPAAGFAEAPRRPRQGDIDYITIATPDSEAAKEFYGGLLGWRFSAGNVPDGWQIDGVHPMAGMHGGQHDDVQLCFRVDDIDASLARVRELGGQAEPSQQRPFGRLASCSDDQGRRFYLMEPAG